MNKLLILFIALLCSSGLYAQSVEAQLSSLAGSKGQLPFWLWANQLGRFDPKSSAIQHLELELAHQYTFKNPDFTVEGKAQLDFILADDNDIRFTELYGGMNWKFLQLKAGAFAEDEKYMGLSTTNGNLGKSRNARPHPRIRAGFNSYVPVFSDWFSVYAFYEEGVLNDERYVSNTRLHNKALYLRFGKASRFQLSIGGEHMVMWAGTHPTYGELQGWEAYKSYVLGESGDENALETDQRNVVGNGYGTYQLEASKAWQKLEASFYISHPFDDFSGMKLLNKRDNLYGLFLRVTKETPLFKGILLEYYYTKHQSGNMHLKHFPDGSVRGQGLDDYFNHGIYKSGVTYHQMSMASPLFAPLIVEDGISMGFENTRFSGIHMAASGFLNPSLQWKVMGTYTHNLGKYKSETSSTYDPARKQAATLLQLSWQLKQVPVVLNGAIAADHGSLFDKGQSTTRIGGQFSIAWKIKE